jgi:serine/threonine protein phosphatase 1
MEAGMGQGVVGMNGTVQRFHKNTAGRDYVVGDIHGCFSLLSRALHDAGFDLARDRLFSVGDLVDRGPDSWQALAWLRQPWFHAIRGNHEQMAIGVAAGKHDLANYAMNGGSWFLLLDPDRQQEIASAFCALPVCIELETDAGLVGFVHADIEGHDWPAFLKLLESSISNTRRSDLMEAALWSRDRIRVSDQTPVDGLERLYVGHTPVKEPQILGNVHYIDTGAVFGRMLTLICITDRVTYQVQA